MEIVAVIYGTAIAGVTAFILYAVRKAIKVEKEARERNPEAFCQRG